MFGFTVKAPQNGVGSPRATPLSPREDVGEIDTSSPFRSVKAAVSLFGEVVSPIATTPSKKLKEERVLEKETQHYMMIKELDHFKDQVRSAEIAKSQALRDLQRANATHQQLTKKLETLTESKQAAIKATEAAKLRAKELEEQQSLMAQLGIDAWKLEVDSERERLKATTAQLTAIKQELANVRHDFDLSLEDKLAVFQRAEDAEHIAQLNQERQSKLSKEVAELHQMLDQVKLNSHLDQEEHLELIAEKEKCLLAIKSAKEEADKEIKRLGEEYEPAEILQEKIDEKTEAIRFLQEQLNEIQTAHINSMQTMVSELDNAKQALQEAIAEENSVRSYVDSIKLQLEEVKRECSETEQRALAAESTVEQMQAEIEKRKTELEAAMSRSASAMQSSIQKLSAEAQQARHEAEDIKKNAKLLKQEAASARISTKETKGKLKIALKEAGSTKAAEKRAVDHIHNYSKSEVAGFKGSGSIRKIRLSVEEFEAINKKIEAFRNEADTKVATAMAHVASLHESEKEILDTLEVILKEDEAIQSKINEALKTAEMAETATRVVESELQKWRQIEHK